MSEDPSNAPQRTQSLTIKQLLIPLLAHPKVAHTIKYVVYGSLLINFVLYVIDDYGVYSSTLPPDAPWQEVIVQFSTSIDMIAWLGLVFLFELETYAIPDEAFTKKISTFLKAARAVCYVSIFYAAYGYTVNAMATWTANEIPEVDNVCQFADQGTSLQINIIDYVEITSANCSGLTDDSRFYHFDGDVSVIGESMLAHVQNLGWIDIINAYVWIIVVFLIEVQVWLQANDRFGSPVLTAVRRTETLLYLVLIADALIWGYFGYYLYLWDSFLWICGFWAIELNLAEWEKDRLQELQAA